MAMLCSTKLRVLVTHVGMRQEQFYFSTSHIKNRRKNHLMNRETKYNERYVKGFLDDIARQNTKINEAIDFEKSLLEKAKIEKSKVITAMKWKKSAPKDMTRQFTYKQMEQIRFLHQEDPYVWTYKNLAISFGSKPDTIARIVRGTSVPDEETRRRVDAIVLGRKRSNNLYKAEDAIHSDLGKSLQIYENINRTETSKKKMKKNKESFLYSNKWFQNIEEAKFSSNHSVFRNLEVFRSIEDICDEDSIQPENIFESDLHYEDLFADNMEEDLESEDLEDEEDTDHLIEEPEPAEIKPFKLVTTDNVNFYDESGRFLYKIV